MTPNQLFVVSVRILGIYLLVEAVMQVPTGIVTGIRLLWYWAHGSQTNTYADSYAVAMLYPAVFTALIGFFLFLTVGAYLAIGAPHLLRYLKIDSTEKQIG